MMSPKWVKMGQNEPQSARNGWKTLEAREERVQSDAVILSKKKRPFKRRPERERSHRTTRKHEWTSVQNGGDSLKKKKERQLTCEHDLARDEDQQC